MRSGGAARTEVPSAQGISRGPTDAAAEEFFTLFSKASSNVESAAILMEFAAVPHERWAELAKRMHDTEHAGDDTT